MRHPCRIQYRSMYIHKELVEALHRITIKKPNLIKVIFSPYVFSLSFKQSEII